jgi:hypothetical protein
MAHARIGVIAFVLILVVVIVQQVFASSDSGQAGGPQSHVVTRVDSTPSPSPVVTATLSPTSTTPARTLAVAPTPPAVIPTVTPTIVPPMVNDVMDGEHASLADEEPKVSPTEVEPDEDVAPDTAGGATTAPLLGDEWEYAIHTWDGGVVGLVMSAELNVRAAPAVDAEIIATTWMWRPVVVYDAVYGDWVGETDVWYAIGAGEFVSAAFIEPFVPTIPETTHAGAWIDVNLTTGYAVAWQDDLPVYAAMISYGKPGFETPLGDHTIFERRETDTLDSTTTGIPPGDAESYYLTDVPYVQYFAEGGFALHANTWDEAWELGGATSHGCVNLTVEDAAFFWNFLEVGSVVSVHE